MAYRWNLLKGDITRLKALFASLQKTFRTQKIDDELLKIDDDLEIKWFELNKLMNELTEMVDNSEKRYQVDDEEKQIEGGALDDEEKQNEGGALDDEEKQHERSVVELKKHERIMLELWLEELQEDVFNTEDLVDKIHTEALDGQVSEKMEDIRRCIESYVKAGDVLGLAGEMRYQQQSYKLMEQYMHNDPKEKQRQRGLIGQLSQMETLSPTDYIYSVDESEVFGMDCDREEIIKLLLSNDANDKQLSVISIVGNGRIGKTTLARLVYNEQRVSHHFDRKAWVDVPDDFNWVTKAILKFLTSQYKDLREKYNNLHKLKLDQLGFELQNCLKGKRFLLVLDGAKQIPSSEGWKALLSAFKNAANGSHIIVTARNKVIASKKYAVRTYRMEPLSEEKCWQIFANFAFGDQNPTSDTQLEVIGKEIVQMCHGLPSSVRILGSLLRFKLQQEEWEAILKRLKPSSDSREDSRENVNVVPNLRLPEDLKRCLAYCSIFPQDYEFEREKLVLLWMAEGFLKSMVAASKIIDELKYFFQQPSRNESSFLMCMNNLAAYVSTSYCFRLEGNHPSEIPLNTRYLSLVGGKYENSVIFEAIDRAKLIRTFLPLDHESRHLCATELQNLFSKLQFLRVLSLLHYHITEIPDSIGNLEHLRYIDLSHTPIKRLPESVCELHNLQSLILSNCHSLTELPEHTSNLVNLLNLNVSGSDLREMPKGMSKLRNLELLPCFVVGKKGGSALKELCHIISQIRGTLHISKLQNVTYEDGVDILYLGGMDLLEELVLEWDDNTADPENARKELAALKPCTRLERLTINFYCGLKFPEWFRGERQFKKMVLLRLSNCKNCSTLPSLSNLPYLRVLIIECMDAVEEVGPDFSAETSTMNNKEFKRLVRQFEAASKSCFGAEPYPGIHKPFKSLERLTFEGMSKWTKWVPFDEFPRLKQLCIRRCPKLKGNLPTELPLVERVEISESQELVTALTTEASLSNLHYRKKIVFISDDKVTFFTSEGATGSSSLMIEGKVTEKPKETEERGETKEETNVEEQTTSKTNWSKHGQKESTKDPSQFPSSEEKSSIPLPQHAAECSSLVTPSRVLKSERATGSSSLIIEGEDIEKLKETEESEETDKEIQNPFEFPFLEEISSLPLPQRTAECSLLVTPGEVTEKLEETQKSGETKEETNVEIQTTSQTKWSKQEQKEYIEDPSQFPFLEVESTLPLPQRAAGQVPSSPAIKISKEISETEESGECEEETDADIETTLKAEGITPEQDESNEEDPSPSSLFLVDKSSLPLSQTPNSRNEADVLTNTWSNQDGVEDLSFETIKFSEISELMDLPTRVHSLKIEGRDDLEYIPKGVMSSELSLQDLYIINCCSLKSFPKDHPPTALKILYIRNCKKLKFPLTEKKTHQDALLEYLCIGSSCDSLKLLSLDLFPNLKSLSIWDCANLELLSMPVQKNLTSLEALEIRDCPNLVSFLGGGLCTMNLTSIWLSNCKKLEKLPELNTLDSLQSMFINNCPELVSLSEKGLPSRLSLLSITFCNKLKLKDEWGLDGLDYLRRLEIEGGCVDVGSFPEKFLPSNVSSLRISRLLNLKNLDNKGFQQLTALQRLEISFCPNLQSLPEDGFPSSLSFLCIKECPLLTSKFRNRKGKDWSKIDHISFIEIDEEVIS